MSWSKGTIHLISLICVRRLISEIWRQRLIVWSSLVQYILCELVSLTKQAINVQIFHSFWFVNWLDVLVRKVNDVINFIQVLLGFLHLLLLTIIHEETLILMLAVWETLWSIWHPSCRIECLVFWMWWENLVVYILTGIWLFVVRWEKVLMLLNNIDLNVRLLCQ